MHLRDTSGELEEDKLRDLDKLVHLEQGQAVSPEQQQRVEEAVQLATPPGASRRQRA